MRSLRSMRCLQALVAGYLMYRTGIAIPKLEKDCCIKLELVSRSVFSSLGSGQPDLEDHALSQPVSEDERQEPDIFAELRGQPFAFCWQVARLQPTLGDSVNQI